MIVVSHRGPYRFEPRGDGSFSTHRSAGGVGSALRSGSTRRERGDVDRGRLLRRRSRSGPLRSHRRGGHRPPAGRDRPRPARHALRRHLERRAVVLVPRPLRSRPPAGVRSALPRGVGGVHRRERRLCRGDGRGRGSQRHRARARLPTRARRRPTPRAPTRSPDRALHAHALLRPRRHARAPRLRSRGALRGDGEQPGGLSQHALGPRVPAVGPSRARPGRDDRAGLRREPRARRRRTRCGRRERRDARGRPRARRRRRRPPRDRALRPGRALEEHRARLPRVRPSARSPARSAGARRVRRDALSVPPGSRVVPRVRERDRTGRRARERPLGDA